MPNRPMTERTAIDLGIKGVCPHCGEGRLFSGFLKVAPSCRACGLDYDFADAGDGPAVFIMMIVGFIVVGLALLIEFKFHAPVWLNMLICLPLATGLAIGALRPLKGIMIAQQYRQSAREGRLDQPK